MADKIKRGIEVTIKSTGETVWVERDRQDGTILVRDTQNESPQTVYFDTTIDNITLAKKAPKGLKMAKPKTLNNQERAGKESLNEFFDKMAENMPYNCMNCGKPLYAIKQFAKRCVTAHILPKSTFPSVATNPDNIIFLGAGLIGICFCHDDYDGKGAEYRTQMPVYRIVKQQFEKLKPCLTNKELVMAYSYFNIKWQ